VSTVKFGDRDITLERFTLTKAMRVITLLKLIQQSTKEIGKTAAEFRREYAQDNVLELDRVEAKMRYGPRPIVDADGELMFRDGTLVTEQSPVDRMTEEDWTRSNQKLRIRQEPTPQEMMWAVFPVAFEHAEETVNRLLGLVIMSNGDVDRYVKSGEIWERVDELVNATIAPAYLDEIMELAVAAAELIEGQVMTKAKALGDRVGKLRQMFGVGTKTSTPETSPTSSEQPEQPRTDSASPSPDSSTGLTPPPSSPSPGTPSTPSESNSIASAT
jgi:hypothetical protein